MESTTETSATVHRASDADWQPFGTGSSFRFISEGSAGTPDIYEERSEVGTSAPLHRHPWDSWELVLDGEVLMVVEDVEHRLGPGDAIHIQPGATHSYVVLSPEARIVGVGTSAGAFPDLQRNAGPLFADPEGPDMAVVGALAAKAGVELLGPPLSLPGAQEQQT